MARRSLTQLAVDRLRPPATGRLEYWDTHLSGFGLRISASGAKSWMVMYRLRGERKQRRQTLGSLAEIPSVADARARALKSLEAARLGIDLREAVGTNGEGIEGAPERGTLAAVAARFVREHADQHCRPSTAAEYRRIFDREIIPHWGALPAAKIAKRDVNALLDAKAQAYPLQANELRKHLRTFFRWAKDEELVDVDPTEGTRLRAKPIARDRVLSDVEIAWFWKACDELGWPFGRIAQLLLLTAQRRDEVAGMRWPELEPFDRRLWVIPAVRTKNGKAHEVHLCEPAARILAGLPRLGEIVFSSTGTTAPSGYSRAKSRLDRLMAGYAAVVSVADWTLHDLRRTATSGMARLGVAPHIVDKILNHSGGTIRGVAAIYNRHQYSQERKAALELWGTYIAKLVKPSVVTADRLSPVRGAAD
jgi:integrase